MRNLLLLILFSFLVSCQTTALENELEQLQGELKTALETIATLEKEESETGGLVHIVFFRLNSDADTEVLITEIKKLSTIPEVQDLTVGPFENLGDARALSEYSIVMEMGFQDLAAYKRYQEHPTHLALRENAKPMMSGPPATYDYLKQ